MLDAQGTLNRRLLESDLISGAVELSLLHQKGIPPLRRENFSEPPGTTLERLLTQVEPSDLAGQAGALWHRARAVWKRHGKITWPLLCHGADKPTMDVAVWMESHGLGIGLHAPLAARKLLALSQARVTHQSAQTAAVVALESAREAVRGV